MAAKWYPPSPERGAVGLRRNSIFNWFLREADFAKGVMKFRERATVSKFSRAISRSPPPSF